MSYDILLFDADQTLFNFDASEKDTFYKIIKNFGVCPDEQNYALYCTINTRNWREYEAKLVSKERLLVRRFEQFFDAMGVKANAAKANEQFLEQLSYSAILFPETPSVLKQLKSANKRLFIITNGVTKVQERRLELSGIADYFEKVFISEKIGHGKPEKPFFDFVENNIENFEKSRAVVIGDSITSDIRGANNAGINCIWLNLKGIECPTDVKVDHQVGCLSDIVKFII